MDNYSYIDNAHPEYIDQLYREYKQNPDSVEESWRKFFEGFDFAKLNTAPGEIQTQSSQKELAVLNLINGYRTRGHFFTKTNPVRNRRKYSPTLAIENFNLTENDLDTVFQAG
ncbi:MAG: 2-oxoglutarate dehydrogenase E1 component, partial [Calditrichaceae bacterium]